MLHENIIQGFAQQVLPLQTEFGGKGRKLAVGRLFKQAADQVLAALRLLGLCDGSGCWRFGGGLGAE
jgi:hypothetical protein